MFSKDLNPKATDNFFAAGDGGVFVEVHLSPVPKIVVDYYGIPCYKNRCGQSLIFQAALYLDGTGLIELSYFDVDVGVYYATTVGLSPGYQPMLFEEVGHDDSPLLLILYFPSSHILLTSTLFFFFLLPSLLLASAA